MNSKAKIYLFVFFLFGVTLFSCKLQENRVKIKINHRSTKFLVKKLIEEEFHFNTLSAKSSVSFDNGKKTTFKTHIRIKKDSVIWLSITPALGIEMARVLITQDTVKLMNRKDNEYFVGDFEYINKLFGIDIDYQMLEAMLIGNSLDFEKNEKIRSATDRKKQMYYLSTEKKRKIRKEIKKEKGKIKEQTQVLWLDPLTYKINNLLLSTPESNKSLKGSFTNHKPVETAKNQLFPHNLFFKLESDTFSMIDVNYIKVTCEKELSFSFKIPSKYEQIKK